MAWLHMCPLYVRILFSRFVERPPNGHAFRGKLVTDTTPRQMHREWTDLPRDTPGWRPWAELGGMCNTNR